MRRIVTLLAGSGLLLAGIFLSAPAAQAKSPVISDPAKIAKITGLAQYDQVAAGDSAQPTGSFAMVDGPGTPPAGSGSLQIGVGSYAATGVGLLDQSFVNYYQVGSATPLMYPVAYQPSTLALSFGYQLSDASVPLKVEITLWHNGGPVTYQASLTGTGWQTFHLDTAQLIDASDPTGPAQPLTAWAAPGDSLSAVFIGIDHGTASAGQSFNVDQLRYGFLMTQGPRVNPVNTYDFETSGGVNGPTLKPWAGVATTTGGNATVTDMVTLSRLSALTQYDTVAVGSGTGPTGSFAMVDGPGTPPAGAGSLRIGVGKNSGTGVGLLDQSYRNYYNKTGAAAPTMFPLTYQPAALVLSFDYELGSTTVPAKVEITLWHGGAPVVYETALTGTGWQNFDLASAPLVAQNDPTGPAQSLTDWAAPGDSLAAVFVGIDNGSGQAGQTVNLDELTYGVLMTKGPAVNPVTRYDFEVPTPTQSHSPTPTHSDSSSASTSKSPTPTQTSTTTKTTPAPTSTLGTYVPPGAGGFGGGVPGGGDSGGGTPAAKHEGSSAPSTVAPASPSASPTSTAQGSSLAIEPVSKTTTSYNGPSRAALLWARIALIVTGAVLILVSRRRSDS